MIQLLQKQFNCDVKYFMDCATEDGPSAEVYCLTFSSINYSGDYIDYGKVDISNDVISLEEILKHKEEFDNLLIKVKNAGFELSPNDFGLFIARSIG